MATSTWKVMIALSVGLIVFAVYVSFLDLSLGPVGTVMAFVLALLFGGILYATMRFGFSLGERLGGDEE